MRIDQRAGWRGALVALAVSGSLVGPAGAQWLDLPVPGTPRTADGKPNLSAPTPRAADGRPSLAGIWRVDTNRYNNNLVPNGGEAPMLPWAAALFKQRLATQGFDRPGSRCMPHGTPDAMTVYNFKVLQLPEVMVHLYEEMHKYRQIHTDGRPLPVDPDPAWYGYSIGRWDGETFVAETSGFRGEEGSWLDNDGHPHTDALRLTERFRRINWGRMELDVTVDDPKAYARPWNAQTMRFDQQPDTELLEHLCENNRSFDTLQKIWKK
jgi:hypothetical protein